MKRPNRQATVRPTVAPAAEQAAAIAPAVLHAVLHERQRLATAMSRALPGRAIRGVRDRDRDAITRSCCYQIELWAYKRTIVDCNGNNPHRDFSFYSLTIAV